VIKSGYNDPSKSKCWKPFRATLKQLENGLLVKGIKVIVTKTAKTTTRIIGVDNHFQEKQLCLLKLLAKSFPKRKRKIPQNNFISPQRK